MSEYVFQSVYNLCHCSNQPLFYFHDFTVSMLCNYSKENVKVITMMEPKNDETKVNLK